MTAPEELTDGVIKQQVTHDFILDVYESSIGEEDPEVVESIVAACKVLSENIGTYLVDINNDNPVEKTI